MLMTRVGDTVAARTDASQWLPRDVVLTVTHALGEGHWMVRLPDGSQTDAWEDEIEPWPKTSKT